MILKKRICKINWNAVSAIAAVIALIITVIVANNQMKENKRLFEKQFKSDSLRYARQFSFDSTFIMEQQINMKEQLDLSKSSSEQNLFLAKKAIIHDDENKSRLIPKIVFTDLLEKQWHLKLLLRLLDEKDNESRIDFIFHSKLNLDLYNSIDKYDLFLAFENTPKTAYDIVLIYNNLKRFYFEYEVSKFNTNADSIDFILTNDYRLYDKVVPGRPFGDILLLESTLFDIEQLLQILNKKEKHFKSTELIKMLNRKVTTNDILFHTNEYHH